MRPYKLTSILFVIALVLLDIAYLGGIVEWWLLLLPFVAYISLLALGAIFIEWNFYLRSFNKGKKEKQIALTFDDGPAEITPAILDVLKEQNVQAAFFTIGKNAAKYPELVQRWHEEGHVVGNHSYHHGFNFDWQSRRKMVAEIEQTNHVILTTIGVTPLLFRPPYGVTNPNLARAVSQTGMYSIGWSVRSLDTRAKEPSKLLNKLLNEIKSGDIILLHDSMAITREILTDFIVQARKKGFTFARVDQLLDIDAYA
ncbi:polysaccharide deacetylase family protein [Polluticoccus soli]|uniref:polysaccharide deacetylase family protein n=1 Tax=Polluticoccus soli TaxID=3034150 RepID=UPI0023E28D71|nr:polysaccharide deacetylase family protein [Flavipsychrobacter sp. JY13-12]